MLRCTECGGTNLKMAYWLDPNTKEIIEPVYENLDEAVEHQLLMCIPCGTETIIEEE
jgi:hypothetical protein